MANAKNNKKTRGGRIEDTGTQDAGVWPVSGPPSGNPDVRIHGQSSFGQGERGAAGYADSGDSEVFAMPPGDRTTEGNRPRDSGIRESGAGAAGSNAGEVDPGVAGSSETTGEPPDNPGGSGFGNAIGGGGQGDVAETGDETAG